LDWHEICSHYGEKVCYHFGFWLTKEEETYVDLGFTPSHSNHQEVIKTITLGDAGHYKICCYCKDWGGMESAHDQLKAEVKEG